MILGVFLASNRLLSVQDKEHENVFSRLPFPERRSLFFRRKPVSCVGEISLKIKGWGVILHIFQQASTTDLVPISRGPASKTIKTLCLSEGDLKTFQVSQAYGIETASDLSAIKPQESPFWKLNHLRSMMSLYGQAPALNVTYISRMISTD